MRSRIHSGVLVLLSSSALVAADCSEPATVHRDFDPTNLRLVYTFHLLENQQATDIAQLRQLLDGGMNTIVTGVREKQEVDGLIAKIRADGTLSKYKYLLSVGGRVFDHYRTCRVNPQDCLAPAGETADFLDHVISAEKANADLFVGYYTFDEPTREDDFRDPPLTYPVDAWYQRLVYQYIRARDADAAARPVAIANTFCDSNLTDATIDKRASADVQDLVLIDQYTSNGEEQRRCLDRWKRHGLLVKPTVFVLFAATPRAVACRAAEVSLQAQVIDEALESLYPQQPLPFQRYGYGYFAHWPYEPNRDVGSAIDDCPPILDEVVNHTRVSLDRIGDTLAWVPADVNGDRRMDVAQPYDARDGLGVTVFRPVNGTYQDGSAGGRAQMGTGPGALAWLSADVDGDGRTDLLQPWNNAGRLGLIAYRANGSAYDLSWGNPDMGAGSPALAWLMGDVDGDGRTDLLQPWNNAGRLGLIVYRSNGVAYDLTWSANDMGAGSPALAWLTGDVDGDGRTDLLQPWNNAGRLGLIIYRSNGVGYDLTWSANDMGAGSPALAWLTADVDGDGRTDLLQPWDNAGRLGLIVHRSNGVGYDVTWSANDLGAGSPALARLTADVNGDGRTDLLLPWDNGGRVGLIVYRSNGVGYQLTWSATDMGAGSPALAWLAGDADGDARTDLVQLWNDSGHLRFITYRSTGSGFVIAGSSR